MVRSVIPFVIVSTNVALIHWGRVTHICVSKLTIIGSDNGLSPDRRQTIIWTNAGILLIGPLGTNVSKILIEIHAFSFKEMHLKMSSGKWRPFCLGLNVLKINTLKRHYICDDEITQTVIILPATWFHDKSNHLMVNNAQYRIRWPFTMPNANPTSQHYSRNRIMSFSCT